MHVHGVEWILADRMWTASFVAKVQQEANG